MKRFRFLLFPMAGIYYIITALRNKLFDYRILKSKQYELPVICIGNLSTGGTGKSPMTEYIIGLLSADFKVATLSRGYGRKTRGYLNVKPASTAREVGDEPLQFARKFSNVQVTVCEDRQAGIETLLSQKIVPDVILLDDAYQHRKVTAGFNILLTPYKDLYSDDYLLPVGNLREPKIGAHRAHVIVVTKCPEILPDDELKIISNKLKVQAHQKIFFSKIVYDDSVYSSKGEVSLNSLKVKKVTLVTGIANPKPLLDHLRKQGLSFEHKAFKDHHNFSSSDIAELETKECILTTEKDFVRLQSDLKQVLLFYLPIKIDFLRNSEGFNKSILDYVS